MLRGSGVTLVSRRRRTDDLPEHAGQVGLVAEAELMSQSGPVGGLSGMRGRCSIKDAKPLDHPLGPDPDVLRKQPLHASQT